MIPEQILNIGVELSGEGNMDKLLDAILVAAMDISRADAGTIYTLTEDALSFRIMRNRTMGISQGADGERPKIPPVPLREEYVCSYSAMHNETVVLPDVYESELFDFSGPRNYDKMTGYRTRSMFVMPLHSGDSGVIGVLQLLNATAPDGRVVPFSDEDRGLIDVLSSFSAVALGNIRHSHEIKRLMFSFFDVFITAVDERTPYNASHTRRVVEMLLSLMTYINRTSEAAAYTGVFDTDRMEIMVMCAWLHDIGKLTTPLSVMNKATRLGDEEDRVYTRLERIGLLSRLALAEGRATQAEYDETISAAQALQLLVQQANSQGNVDDAQRDAMRAAACRSYTDVDGREKPWLTSEEVEMLCIVRGTLTAGERAIMERHAATTTKLLAKIAFSAKYRHVQEWAGSHHEFIDGTGYPTHIADGSIPIEVRMLTVLDILEALTTDERPYKPPMPPDRAVSILRSMASEGKLDGQLVEIVAQSEPWLCQVSMQDYIKTALATI